MTNNSRRQINAIMQSRHALEYALRARWESGAAAAIEVLTEAINQLENHPELLVERGIMFRTLGNAVSALADFEPGIAVFAERQTTLNMPGVIATYADGRVFRACTYLTQGAIDSAQADVQALLAVGDPTFQLQNVQRHPDDARQAEADCESVLDQPWGRMLRGALRMTRCEWDGALADFERMAELGGADYAAIATKQREVVARFTQPAGNVIPAWRYDLMDEGVMYCAVSFDQDARVGTVRTYSRTMRITHDITDFDAARSDIETNGWTQVARQNMREIVSVYYQK